MQYPRNFELLVFVIGLLAALLLSGCQPRVIQKVYTPRQWQNLSEGQLANTVWVDLGRSRDLETVDNVITEELRHCGLQRTMRPPEAGRAYTPAHIFRLDLRTSTGSDQSVRFFKVTAHLIRLETYKPVASGEGKKYYGNSGGSTTRQFGRVPFVYETHPGPDSARKSAVAEAIQAVCNNVEYRELKSGREITQEEAERTAAGISRGPDRVMNGTPFVPFQGRATTRCGYGVGGRRGDLRYGCK
ncbi:MAG: hypothetical protein A3J10_03995 [Candidatus Sungbacteria bacterium RIFCSPLOWO2_02_FULL_54_10]|uniref:Uncharacterized protein n=2 Tax=Candidatus Sungiibacteriota TaxID=1817917 RepID=A0A1G2L918_9BACT|nr:MAG: hypothetical protein A2679_02660 [Candidatus Sungbacteria bacterium RIFCSPHIGHO2_01_FULL_54_26]OHA08127.1 MAG: hypothetical protein A3B34_01850 [Candidatus Sungbacteria bacterium RIFCSPLOWO2_01_FULL_54_21]OHA13038.1 MAG: hypothetical protein A3J10_03995 [Candidatus Sungbacteria bacterium RIFCSPLOWO2_02_FULL_54_10]